LLSVKYKWNKISWCNWKTVHARHAIVAVLLHYGVLDLSVTSSARGYSSCGRL